MRMSAYCTLYGALLSMTAAACASSPPDGEKIFSRQELRADFAQMYRGLKSAHFNLYAFRRADLTASLVNLPNSAREAKLLGQGIAYLRPGPFYNLEAKTGADEWDVSSFREFIDRSFEEFIRTQASRLIIDLRGNPGGDNLFSDVMVSWFADRPFRFASEFKIRVSTESIAANAARIEHDAAAAGPVSRAYAELYARSQIGDVVDFPIPRALPRAGKRFDGQVFVLIDRQSYSNTVAVVALVQDYHFGVILGEATSDMATTYGAMEQFALTHTRLNVGYPKARIVRPNGDLQEGRATAR